jgi:hypothetical protein
VVEGAKQEDGVEVGVGPAREIAHVAVDELFKGIKGSDGAGPFLGELEAVRREIEQADAVAGLGEGDGVASGTGAGVEDVERCAGGRRGGGGESALDEAPGDFELDAGVAVLGEALELLGGVGLVVRTDALEGRFLIGLTWGCHREDGNGGTGTVTRAGKLSVLLSDYLTSIG